MQLGNITGTIPTEQQKSVKNFDYTNCFRQTRQISSVCHIVLKIS